MLASSITPSIALAQDAREWTLSLGAGVAVKKNLRVGNTYEDMDKKVFVKPIPFLQASYKRVSLGAGGLSFMALGSRMANVSAFIKREGDRYHGLNMIPRKDSFFAGVSAKYLNYGLNVSHDINGRSKGTILQFNYNKMFIVSEKFFLAGNLGLDWFDDKYAEYYYSVRKYEATASRKEYHLTNYIQPTVGLLPVYKLGEKSSLMSVASVKLVPKKVRNSPTMNGDKLEIGGIFGYTYNF